MLCWRSLTQPSGWRQGGCQAGGLAAHLQDGCVPWVALSALLEQPPRLVHIATLLLPQRPGQVRVARARAAQGPATIGAQGGQWRAGGRQAGMSTVRGSYCRRCCLPHADATGTGACRTLPSGMNCQARTQ